jgi:hypothetical protein
MSRLRDCLGPATWFWRSSLLLVGKFWLHLRCCSVAVRHPRPFKRRPTMKPANKREGLEGALEFIQRIATAERAHTELAGEASESE